MDSSFFVLHFYPTFVVFGLTLLCDIKYHGRAIVRVFYEIVVPQIDIKKGADCTILGSTDYDKLRTVIEYAHTWRQTHKK